MADIHEYLVVKKGKTSKTMPVFIKDSAVTTGAGKTGLLFNTGTPKWYYWREDTGNAGGVSVTLATMTRGTWATGGFIEIDATNLPGWYQVGVPNAALASGSEWCLMELSGFTGGAAVTFLIQLVDYDLQDAVRLGLSALPNVASGSAGAIPVTGTGANQLDVDASGRVNVGKWLGTVPSALVSGQVQALSPVTRTGTAQAGAAGTITLDAGASATDNIYNDQVVFLLSGTGVGQARLITGYVGSTKVATVVPNWQTNPDNTSVFVVLGLARVDIGAWLGTLVTAATAGIPDVNTKNYNNQAATTDANNLPKVDVEDWKAGVVPAVTVTGVPKVDVADWLGVAPSALISGQVQSLGGVTRSGTAQAGGASTITLDAGASATDNIYNDQMAVILSGTGVGQARLVTGYVGSTKVATVSPSWQTNPDNTSVFAMVPDTQMRVVAGQFTVKKNTALPAFMFLMVDSSDGRTPKTGLTVTATRSIDGAAFGACTNSGTIAEIANGWYKIDLSASDLNGSNIALRFSATGADATNLELLTQA